jgi:aconitate hydratase
MRGTFGNIRLRNEMVPDTEGDWTAHQPSGEKMRIFDASSSIAQLALPCWLSPARSTDREVRATGRLRPNVIGSEGGHCRDLRTHSSQQSGGHGSLPLQFTAGQNRESLGLTGEEAYDVVGIHDHIKPGETLQVRVHRGMAAKARST